MADVEVDSQVVQVLPLEAAAAAEGSDPPNLLPGTLVDVVLQQHASDLAKLMAAELNSGFRVASSETLSVSKPTRGRRPVAILAPRERVLYRALAEALGDDVPPPDRGTEAFNGFKNWPLVERTDGYVVMADVSACYQYIDHEVIYEEVVSRTADSFLADAVVGFLQALHGRTFGLPQNREASHRIAELALGIPERALVRKGYDVGRYSDDFRICVATRTSAHEAIEDLDEALRSIGLTLNDEKTVIKSHSEYADWAGAAERRVEEIQDETAVELTAFSYDGEMVLPDGAEVLAESAERFLDVWREDVEQEQNRYGPAAVVGRQILAVALGVLAAVNDARALDYCPKVLAFEPSLTPNVARYMRALVPAHEHAMDTVFDSVLESGDTYLSPWQSIWLMQVLHNSFALTAAQRAWLTHILEGRSDYARASAANTLAVHGLAEMARIVEIFDVASPAARPLLAAAMAVQGGLEADVVEAICKEDQLFRWIFNSQSVSHP